MKPLLFRLIKSLCGNFLITITILQLCAVINCSAQDFSFTGTRKKDRLKFSLVKNLIIIPIYLNNKGPYNFVLDTGVGHLLITDPVLMDTLNIKRFRTIKILGYGNGDEMEAFLSTELSVSVGRATMNNVSTAILKKDLFNLSSYLGTHISGLLGYPFLSSFVVNINYPSKRLIFQLPSSPYKKKGNSVPLEIIENKPFVNVDINTGRENMHVKLIMDNGASHAISLESYKGQPFPLPDTSIQANLGVGLGGKITGKIGRTASLTIGGYTLKNVLSSFPDYDDVGSKSLQKDRHGNLGADLLRHFNVILDYSNSVMYLRKNQYYRESFDHDMSGMEIYVDDDSKAYFIGRIEPGSPADKAGFKEYDQLISINFKSINTFTLDEICLYFKSKNGRHIILEVLRKGEIFIKLFKLEQRI